MEVTRKDYLISLLNLAKQELMQAERRLGMLSSFYILLMSSLVALGIYLNHQWEIVIPFMCLPGISILITIYAMTPKFFGNIEFDKHNGYNIISIAKITEESFKSSLNDLDWEWSIISSIHVFSRISYKKYNFASVSIYISFPFFLIPKIIIRIYHLIKKG